MPYFIQSTDKPGSKAIRDEHRAAHYAFLQEYQDKLIASGGLQDDAGERFIGSAILLDVDTRAEAEAFVARDPFTAAGLAASVVIERWKMAFLDGVRK